jgi:hypothetical protein
LQVGVGQIVVVPDGVFWLLSMAAHNHISHLSVPKEIRGNGFEGELQRNSYLNPERKVSGYHHDHLSLENGGKNNEKAAISLSLSTSWNHYGVDFWPDCHWLSQRHKKY